MLPMMPDLETPKGTAHTVPEMITALRVRFYLQSLPI